MGNEVAVDVLTGEISLLRSDILYDAGASTNPAIDLGQIQGAFLMAVGHILREKQAFDAKTGADNSNTFTYKPPCAADCPRQFNVRFWNEVEPSGIFGSKAVGEPPM